MKKQVVCIPGGDIFKTQKEYLAYLKSYRFNIEKLKGKKWVNTLEKELGKNYEFLFPSMPNSKNARYKEWKIWFERLTLILNKEVILEGSSLGGLFLVKYLSENRFPKKIKGLFLVAPPFGDREKYYLADFYFNPKNLNKLKNQCKNIYFYHSKDDNVVDFGDFLKYKKYLPNANFREFKNLGHFQIVKFPEIIKDLKNLK